MTRSERDVALPEFLTAAAPALPPARRAVKRPGGLQPWQMAVLLFIVVLATFSPVLTAEYLRWDDPKTIFENADFWPPRLQGLGHYWTGPYLQLYMPVTYSAWAIVAWIAQGHDAAGRAILSPAAFHLFSLLLHATCTVQVFYILRRLVQSARPAMAGALLFGVHPLQTEAVAWATVSSIPLSTAFAFFALLQYLRFSELRALQAGDSGLGEPTLPSGRDRWAQLHFALATAAFAASVLSKASAVVLPAIVVVVEVVLRRRPIRSLWPVTIWLLMAIPIAWVTRVAQPANIVQSPLVQRPVVALDAAAFYLYKLLLPVRLLPDYGRSPLWLSQHPGVAAITWLAPAMLAALCLIRSRDRRWIAGAAAIFALGLLPLLGLTPFVFQHFSTVADRYVYLAMLGPALLAARLLTRLPMQTVRQTIVCAGIVLALLSFRQSRYWHDTVTLFSYVAQEDPQSRQASYVLGNYYLWESQDLQRRQQSAEAREKTLDALREYQNGLRSHPEDSRLRYDVGALMYRLGRNQEAVEQIQAVLGDPIFMEQHGVEAFDTLGLALRRVGRNEDSVHAFRAAVKLKPDDPIARKGLQQALPATGPASERPGR